MTDFPLKNTVALPLEAQQVISFIVVFYLLPTGCMFVQHNANNSKAWWELRRDSSEQAPPAETDEAIIQVYAARAARWRGNVGVHTWIATKRRSEKSYTRLEVFGWGKRPIPIRSTMFILYGPDQTVIRLQHMLPVPYRR